MNYEIKDSGKRQTFPTGSVRDTSEGKGRFDLLSPIALDRLAQHTEKGIKKYGERNWELGQPVARFLDSAVRHIYDYIEGKRDEDHLAAAMWNVHGAIHTEEMVQRGVLPADLLKGLPNYLTAPEPQPTPPPSLKPQKYRLASGGKRLRWWLKENQVWVGSGVLDRYSWPSKRYPTPGEFFDAIERRELIPE